VRESFARIYSTLVQDESAAMSFRIIVKSIQGIMRQDPGVDGDAQRIRQLVWLLF
jgi:hypothetical protein